MTTLLYHPTGWKSAKALALALSIPRLRHKHADDFDGGSLIRWGSAAKVPVTPSLEINPREVLTSYKNRTEELSKLKEGGVSVPWFSDDYNEVADYCQSSGEAKDLILRNFPDGKQPMGGKGITIYNEVWSEGSLPSSKHDLYVELIEKHRQFRVHVFRHENNVVTRTRELLHESEIELDSKGHITSFTPNEEARKQPIWNLSTGFVYRYVQGQRPNGVIPEAKLAVESLGLDFGAVDVIVDPQLQPYVLEVNTAPGLDEPTLNWYTKQLTLRLEKAA